MTPKLKKGLIIGAIALAIIIAIVCVALFMNPKTNDNDNTPDASCKHEANKIKILPSVAPSCIEEGLSEGKECTACGTVLATQEVISKINCQAGDWIIDTPATESEDGSKHKECTICETVLEEETLYATGTSALLYSENLDGTYSVTGISDHSIINIIIPMYHNGKLVSQIADKAFYDIRNSISAQSIVLPNSIIRIGERAFAMCQNLKSITIPASVEFIGAGAFGGCHTLKSIDVDPSSNHFSSIDGSLYNKSGTTLVSYAVGQLNPIFVSPEKLTTINAYAFFSCDNIEKIVLHKNVTSIDEEAFYNVTSLKEIEVNEQNSHYISINGNLYTKDQKTLIQYAIGNSNDLFAMPENVEKVGKNALIGATHLQTLIFSDKVSTITTDIFSSCYNLSNIKLGSSISDINVMAFYLLPIEKIEISDDNPHYIAIDSVIYSKDGKTLVFYPGSKQDTVFSIPDGVETIPDKAFNADARSNLKTIKIPSSVKYIGVSFLGLSKVESIEIDPENANYTVVDGVLYSKDLKTLIYYPVAKTSSSFTVENGAETLVMGSFYNNKYITTLNLPSTLKSITLYYCNNLTTINFNGTVEEWNSVVRDIALTSYTVHCTNGDVKN